MYYKKVGDFQIGNIMAKMQSQPYSHDIVEEHSSA